MHHLIGIGLILISGSAFGTLAIFVRLAYEDGVTPISLLFLRFGIASIGMLFILFFQRNPIPRGRHLLGLALMGGLGYVGQALSYFTALTLIPAGLVALRGPAFPVTAGGWASVIAVALISTIVAIATFFAGLKRVGPTNASMLSTIEPVVTVVLAAVVLNETLPFFSVIGGVMIILAVILLARSGVPSTARGGKEAL